MAKRTPKRTAKSTSSKEEQMSADTPSNEAPVIEGAEQLPVNDKGELVINEAEVELTKQQTKTVKVQATSAQAPVPTKEAVEAELEKADQQERLDEVADDMQTVVIAVPYSTKDSEELSLVLEGLKKSINQHFLYLTEQRQLVTKPEQLKELVTFANKMVRLTRLPEKEFYPVMNHLLTLMRQNRDVLTSDKLLRYNITAAKTNNKTMIEQYSLFMVACFKFADNYAKRKQIYKTIDFEKVCVGRTVKEANLMKGYFQKLANG